MNALRAAVEILAGHRRRRARSIAVCLWHAQESYQAGAIDRAEFMRRSRALWADAEKDGVTADVKTAVDAMTRDLP